jgi:hypothetical protein
VRATNEVVCLIVNAPTANTVTIVEQSVANFVICVANFSNSRKIVGTSLARLRASSPTDPSLVVASSVSSAHRHFTDPPR